MTKKTVVFCWGNDARGDDALGPLMHTWLSRWVEENDLAADIEIITDYQLQIEHTLDMVGADAVWFVDASLSAKTPFEETGIHPCRDSSYSSHALSPQALLAAYAQSIGTPPAATLLAIRGDRFELGEPPTPAALNNLSGAFEHLIEQLAGAARGPD